MVPQVLLAVHTWSGQPYGKRGQTHYTIGLSNRLLNLTKNVVDVPELHVVLKMPVCHFPRGARMMSSQVNRKLSTKLTRCSAMVQPLLHLTDTFTYGMMNKDSLTAVLPSFPRDSSSFWIWFSKKNMATANAKSARSWNFGGIMILRSPIKQSSENRSFLV